LATGCVSRHGSSRASGRRHALLRRSSTFSLSLVPLATRRLTRRGGWWWCAAAQVRLSIARVLTVISQTTRDELRKAFEGKKYQPGDLRQKKTRAIRRALSKKDAALKTVKQAKKDAFFPMRKYAVKA
jgi:hypothetical protein